MKTDTSVSARPEGATAELEAIASAAPSYQYDAFISYSSRYDYNRARKVESFLESFHRIHAPAGSTIRRLQICRDGSDFKLPVNRGAVPLEQDDPVWDIIRAELVKSRYLIVLCSPGAVASAWMSKEISWALDHSGAEWILPVVTEAKDPINQPDECFPAELRAANIHQTRIWYDLRGSDKQAGTVKVRDYEDELVRLASDLLGWEADKYGPLAAVWEREQLKRRRRQATIAIIVAAVLIAVAGVAIWQAVVAKWQARRARANAIVQTADASFDPLTAALLLTELSPDEEPEGGMRVAERLASSQLPRTVMRGHTGRITKVAFSPDQSHVLTASLDGTTRLWSADGRGDPLILGQHSGAVTDAVFSPDGSLVATASGDKTARVWPANGAGAGQVLGHDEAVERVQFTFDGRWLATVSQGRAAFWQLGGTARAALALPDNRNVTRLWLSDKSLSGWAAADDASVWAFELSGQGEVSVKTALKRPAEFDKEFPQVRVDSVTFSPDGSHVAFVHDKQALVERLDQTSKPVVLAHDDRVNSLDFNSDGSRAVTASSDGKARVWETESGKTVSVFDPNVRFWLIDLFGKSSPESQETALSVSQAAFTHDGSRVLTFSEDGVVRLWDANNASQPAELRGHLGAEVAAFNKDDTQLVVGADDGTARVWSLSTPAEPLVLNHPKPVYAASFSSDGSKVLTASSDGVARVWLQGGAGGKIELDAKAGNVKGAVFNRAASLVATAHEDGSVRLWEIADAAGAVPSRAIGKHEEGAPNGVLFSPDERKLLTWSRDGTVRLWPLEGQGGPTILDAKAGDVWHAEFSPDGGRVLATYDDGTARVWAADGSGKFILLGGRDGHTGTVFDGAFSPDGSRVLTVSKDGTARIWQSDGATPPVVLSGANPGQEWMESCAYSPTGETVVTTSSAGRVWVWRADGSGRPIVLRNVMDIAHTGSVSTVMFSSDGRRIVTCGGMDAAVRVWEADGSGRPINLVGHGGPVMSASFSPNGARVVSAAEDGTARVWRTRWSDIVEHLRGLTTATLTVEQRMILLGESEREARGAYEAAERRMGRTPLPADWKFNYPF
ncbi:MAG TPA: TIR domain-containing protein [Pyrinomonadaceae bacterium]|jgi:WD40 repeat protein